MSVDAGDIALERFILLRPHLEDGVPLTTIARSADVPIGTLRRWLGRYRTDGMAGLERKRRNDKGVQRQPP